jgi:hypothetical protein
MSEIVSVYNQERIVSAIKDLGNSLSDEPILSSLVITDGNLVTEIQVIRLKGMCTIGLTITNNGVAQSAPLTYYGRLIATLPDDCRPINTVFMPVDNGEEPINLMIDISGNIKLDSGIQDSAVLSGQVSYRAESLPIGTGLNADLLDGVQGSGYSLASHTHTAASILTDLKTVDGAGSGLDADLLDGVHGSEYSLASHTHTAASILTDLKTVDGAGSGLDADLLDGVQGSGYSLASHTHTAASILTNLKTVDGAGSGLDADLLWGLSGKWIMPGIMWTCANNIIGSSWKSVGYGNGLFVAVALSGSYNIMTSLDGIFWQPRNQSSLAISSVCYGNGLFVAVSPTSMPDFSQVLTNSEPIVLPWVNRFASSGNYWQSVCYGYGLFVAVANGGVGYRVMTSPDGITWTGRSCPSNQWLSVCYGNGIFVAVSSGGGANNVMTSPNGTTWTIRTTPTQNDSWRSVCYGNGLFVAVAQINTGYTQVMTSPDGITWTLRNSIVSNDWQSVCYGNGLFVAVANSGVGNRVMISSDGVGWSSCGSAADNPWLSVCYGNGLFAAVASSGVGQVMVSGR